MRSWNRPKNTKHLYDIEKPIIQNDRLGRETGEVAILSCGDKFIVEPVGTEIGWAGPVKCPIGTDSCNESIGRIAIRRRRRKCKVERGERIEREEVEGV